VVPCDLGPAHEAVAQRPPRILDSVPLGAFLLTNHELGVMRMIPMPIQLLLDIVPYGPAGRSQPG